MKTKLIILLLFVYKVKADSGYFFPERVEITGTNRKVIELFVSYWPSKIQYAYPK
jgi:hypothetical protein